MAVLWRHVRAAHQNCRESERRSSCIAGSFNARSQSIRISGRNQPVRAAMRPYTTRKSDTTQPISYNVIVAVNEPLASIIEIVHKVSKTSVLSELRCALLSKAAIEPRKVPR